MSFDWSDTIVARATPAGIGARSILRLAGPKAHEAARGKVDNSDHLPPLPWKQRWLRRVKVKVDPGLRPIDAILYAWPAGRSSTGQPMAELHLDAVGPIVEMVEHELVRQGVRRARPGEFTLRSFLAGRMDLTQAEGVLGLIESEDLESLSRAIDLRSGGQSRPIRELRGQLIDLLADIEAGLDFVEEDISFVTEEEIHSRLTQAREALADQLAQVSRRSWEERWARVVLVGPANSGKSSLFNAILGRDQAIVSDEVGTTRDYVSADVRLGDRRFELIDTAGWSPGDDLLFSKMAGQQREEASASADLLLACRPWNEPDREFETPEKVLRVTTKADLAPSALAREGLWVSCRDAESIACLKRAIDDRLSAIAMTESVPNRVRQALASADDGLAESLALVQVGAGQELVSASLRGALDALGEVIGAVFTDDLLDRVFSRFCIGK
jgi:tRNA modification GTPase